MTNLELKDKVVVVTGASAGLGRSEDGLNAAVKEVENYDGKAKAYPTDAADIALGFGIGVLFPESGLNL